MEEAVHLEKARRMEASMRKLDLEQGYEMVIWNCVIGGAHLLNAILQKAGILGEKQYIIHSDILRASMGRWNTRTAMHSYLELFRPLYQKVFPKDVLDKVDSAMEELAWVEEIAFPYVRTHKEGGPQAARQCLTRFENLRRIYEELPEGGRPWM